MNKEQQKLVEHNLNLVPFMINKMGYHYKQDELIDLGWIGLCKGVLTYNSDICELSTYLCSCVYHEISTYLNHLSYQKCDYRVPVLSLDEVFMLPNGECVTLADIIPSNVSVESEYNFILICECFEEALNIIEQRTKKRKRKDNKIKDVKQLICDYFGYKTRKLSSSEIIAKYGVTKQRYCQLVRKFKKEFRKILEKTVDI